MTATKLFILLYRPLIVSNLITTQPAPPAMLLIKVGGFSRHSGVLAFLCFLSSLCTQAEALGTASLSLCFVFFPPLQLFPLLSLILHSLALTTLLFGTPGAGSWLPAHDLWLLRPVPVNLPWLVGETSRPSVLGLAIVGFEGGVLGAFVL